MSWSELWTWVRVMNKQRSGPEPDPESWARDSESANWQRLHAQREMLRGRVPRAG